MTPEPNLDTKTNDQKSSPQSKDISLLNDNRISNLLTTDEKIKIAADNILTQTGKFIIKYNNRVFKPRGAVESFDTYEQAFEALVFGIEFHIWRMLENPKSVPPPNEIEDKIKQLLLLKTFDICENPNFTLS